MAGVWRWAAGAVVIMGLGACQGVGPDSMPRVEAPGVPVAVETIEGAPEALKARVNAEVVQQASARRIDIVGNPADSRYRLKGYLTAYATENGDTALAFVWDVFDQNKKRAQRVTATTVARGQGADPWAQVNETQIAKAASQSMNQVAAFLAGMPVAPPASGTGASQTAMGFAGTE